MESYAPLWCKSNYSFLEGASHPGELVEQAHALGLQTLALTDRDGVYGVVRAHVRARELGVHLICGAQLSLDGGAQVVLLAQDRVGYANLCRLITRGRRRHAKGGCRVAVDEVCGHAEGLLALWPGAHWTAEADADRDRPALAALCGAFGDRAYGLLARHRLPGEVPREGWLRARARELRLPLAAASEVLYHTPARRDLQDVLTCIRHGVSLPRAGRRIRANAEHGLKAPAAFGALCRDDPAAVARTVEIASRCRFSLDAIRYRYPSERLPDGATASDWLRRLAEEGARRRFDGRVPASVQAQIVRELDLIDELDYCGYFLTMWEIVEFCRPERHPVPRPGVGGQLGGLLLPRHHRRRPGPGRSAVRALPVARARRAARHRPRHHARAPGRGDSVRLREVRARPGGDGRQRRPLPLALGRARGGEGAGAARDGGRPAGPVVQP